MDRRKLLTFLTGGMAGIAGTILTIPFIKSLFPAKHLNPADHGLDIKFPKLEDGDMIAVTKVDVPIYNLKRSSEQIAALQTRNDDLLDPESMSSEQPDHMKNTFRSIKPEIFVSYGICTHLGCSVTNRPPGSDLMQSGSKISQTGGFFCPCHGAMYDASGRVYKNMPAPKNMSVPNYEFIDESTIRIINNRSL